MGRLAGKFTLAVLLVVGSIGIGTLFTYRASPGVGDTSLAQSEQDIVDVPPTYSHGASRSVILASVTPQPSATATLLPAPTFEPATSTPTPSPVPSLTPTPTTNVSVSIPGLNGAETPTPTSTPGCEPREDWKLTYTVQFDDTLSKIADLYGVWVDELAEGNCIQDKNVITVGQVLQVPGESQPVVPDVECVPWEVLTPFDGSVTVPADGSVTFNWRGPAAPINLIRIHRPDGTTYERVIELRQNETINVTQYLSLEGTYTWYVYPLDRGFRQISCLEGGPWTFYKSVSSTPTPTMSANQGLQ